MTWCRDSVRGPHIPSARGARADRAAASGVCLLRVGLAVGLLRLCFVGLGLGGLVDLRVGGLVGGSSTASFLPRSMGLSSEASEEASAAGSSVSVREEASSGTTVPSDFRSCSTPWTMRLYSSSVRTAPIEFFAKSRSTPGAASRRTVSSLTSFTVAYMPPIVRTPEPGCMLVAHLRGRCCLLLGRPGHQEHGPDEHDEREEGHETHGSELPSFDRDGERPVGWGYVHRRQGRHRRSLSESALKEQRSAWHRGS